MPRREDCRLRPVAEDDLELVLNWRNSERIRRNMYGDHIISMEEHKAWFNRLKDDSSAVYLLFEVCQTPVGMVYFTDIDRKNSKCFWGFYLGEDNLPRGTGTILGVSGMEYAFEILQIRKLCGEAFQFNSASVKFFQKLGFAREGHFVRHVLKEGVYEDVISFALFKDCWQDRRNELERTAFHV
ncbi:MAG: UDP-4-amino-4,6-dideoxy-N-acetyl-beta-L-altrosamine N-acetyltransferase [Deltaproteobacteria bacterium]|nr:UDP-4-amino-4,6-dideoxy-N-acetyl-beta-L-altrosamine N-acetyltransferase [Deltaproteobacteria bacterium]